MLTDASQSGLEWRTEAKNLDFFTLCDHTTLCLTRRVNQRTAHRGWTLLTRPVATVPRPGMENTSSTGMRKGLSRSPLGNDRLYSMGDMK